MQIKLLSSAQAKKKVSADGMSQDMKACITLRSEEGEDRVSQTQLTMTNQPLRRSVLMTAATHRTTQEGTDEGISGDMRKPCGCWDGQQAAHGDNRDRHPEETPHHGPVC